MNFLVPEGCLFAAMKLLPEVEIFWFCIISFCINAVSIVQWVT